MIWGPNPNAAKTFILQFIYKGGNGWAFVNAPTINKAVEIFTSQTKFKEAHVTNIKETKYYGQNIQICFEGAVTTIPIIANEITVDKELNSNSYNPIANAVVAGKFKSFTDKFSAIYDKKEIDALLREKINKNDLSRVAFSGSYKDLSDMPYIPPAYDDTDIKARITELEEAGFITDFTEQDPTVPDWAKSPHKPTYTASEVGALPNTTHIPVDPVNADWNATSGLAKILNKPSLFSGDYNDLINKPTIPAAYDDTSLSNRVLMLENAGFITTETDPTVPSWAKQSTKPSYDYSEINNTPTIPTVPTNVSAFTNDAGYLTTHQDISGKQDVLTAGDGIAINNNTVRTTGIPFGRCDSTSTATHFTATVPGIDRLEDGVCCMIDNGVVTSASGFTLNVNGLGAKPVYTNLAAATRDTTIFNVAYTMLFVYDETRVEGGCWICYRGYDSNTNTIGYQLRTNSTVRNVSDTARYYKIYFTSADGTKWVPASVNSTNNAIAARPVNQRPIDPFGRIVYTSANSNYAAGANLTATTIWDQYNLTLGYSFNRTGAALTLTSEASVYLKCAPQTDGSAIMDADTPIVQALPTTNDGKIYIFLGVATSATAIELIPHHPVYYHDGTGLRIWTGSTGSSTDLSNYYTKTEVDTAVNNRLKYVLLSQSEYDSLATKDSGTLYLIPNITKYSVSLSVTGTANTQSVTINNVVYQRSEFPIEVNGGDTLNIICSGATDFITITMGGNTVVSGTADYTLTVSNVNDNIVITSYNDAPV